MKEMIRIPAKTNKDIVLKVLPGHFVTPNAHVNYYLDISKMKSCIREAKAVAFEMAEKFRAMTEINTIVCIDGCEIIGAYLAEELTKQDVLSINQNKPICVITPEYNISGQMIFRENNMSMIRDKKVLLLMASATTGQTLAKAAIAINYFGGTITGISTIFSAISTIQGMPIHALYTIADLPDYRSYSSDKCEMCKAGEAVDAFANAYGYSIV